MTREFNEYETNLITRALRLLAFVTDDKRDGHRCMVLADEFASNYRASQMVNEDDEVNHE